MARLFIVLLLLPQLVLAGHLTESQLKVFYTVYAVAKQYKAKDGTTFEKTATAICLRESSLGDQLIGDNEEHNLSKASLGITQIRPETARLVINRFSYLARRYGYMLRNSKFLVSALLHDDKFAATITVHYLIMNYEEALDRNMWNPWFKTVSKYNGGWANLVYVHKVQKEHGCTIYVRFAYWT